MTGMFVTVFGANKEVLKSFAKEIKTSSLVYPDSKGYFFIDGETAQTRDKGGEDSLAGRQ